MSPRWKARVSGPTLEKTCHFMPILNEICILEITLDEKRNDILSQSYGHIPKIGLDFNAQPGNQMN